MGEVSHNLGRDDMRGYIQLQTTAKQEDVATACVFPSSRGISFPKNLDTFYAAKYGIYKG